MDDEVKKQSSQASGELPPGFTVHTMPEEYRSGHRQKSSSWKLPVILGGGVLLIGALGLFFLLPSRTPPQQPKPQETTPRPSEPAANVNVAPETNVNASTPEETNVNASVPEQPPIDVALSKSADADQDGLTDVEELLYKADPQKPDTDEDGFTDGHEVVNLYNPSGREPEKLLGAELAREYKNSTFQYSFLFPASWEAKPLDGTHREIMVKSATEELVQVIIQENLQGLTPEKWYQGVNPKAEGQTLTLVTTKSGMSGVESTDGLSAYLGFTDTNGQPWIVSITYALGLEKELHFETTWQMMVQSFMVQP